MQTDQDRLRKYIIRGGIAFLILAIGLLIWGYIQSQKNPFGDEVQIANLSEYSTDNPTTLDSIKHTLLGAINLNTNPPVTSNSVKDIMIREGSFNRTQNQETQIITIAFIADIESLKQSYSVQYQWHPTKKWTEDMDEYGTVVRCLPVEQLKYGDFSCKDMFTVLAEDDDKLLSQLPYETDQYAVTQAPGIKALILTIWTTPEDERTGSDAAVTRYESEAYDWIKAQGEEPEDWNIEYNIIRASI